ncbi:hypothetical protein ACLOJK_005570 [Asimina triloba]
MEIIELLLTLVGVDALAERVLGFRRGRRIRNVVDPELAATTRGEYTQRSSMWTQWGGDGKLGKREDERDGDDVMRGRGEREREREKGGEIKREIMGWKKMGAYASGISRKDRRS